MLSMLQVGRDPSVHVWDVATLNTVAVLKGQHERGICAVDFSSMYTPPWNFVASTMP